MSASEVTNIAEPRGFPVTSAPDPRTCSIEIGIPPKTPKPFAYAAQIWLDSEDEFRESSTLVGGSREERQGFRKWLRARGFPHVVTLFEGLIDEYDEEVLFEDVLVMQGFDGFEIQISPRASGRYLYVGIWPSAGMIAASAELRERMVPSE